MLRISSKCKEEGKKINFQAFRGFFSFSMLNEWMRLVLYLIPLTCVSCVSAERRSPQPQPAQVLCARGEREGGGVDGRRDGVPETQVTEDHRVQVLSDLDLKVVDTERIREPNEALSFENTLARSLRLLFCPLFFLIVWTFQAFLFFLQFVLRLLIFYISPV